MTAGKEKFMGKTIKRMFRTPFATVYFMIGLLISMFTLFDVLSAYNRALQYAEDNKAFAYKEEAYLSVDFSSYERMDILTELESEEHVNIELAPFYANISGSSVGLLVSTLIQQNEKTHYQLETGTLPELDSETPVIAAGRFTKSYMKMENDVPVLQLEGIIYEVTGVIGCPYSEYQDMNTVIPYRSLTEKQKKTLWEEKKVILVLQSDTVGLQIPLQHIYEQLVQQDPQASVQVSVKKNSVHEQKADTNHFSFLGVIYLLCILISVLVSWYWIQARRKEMAIRKAFGQGIGKITGMLFAEMLAMFVLTAVLYVLLHVFAWLIFGYQIDFRFHVTLKNIVLTAGYFSVTMVMSVLVPVFQMSRIQPAALVNTR